jgi:hypothetical protein
MPRFRIRDIPYSIYISGADGAAGNALSCANSSSLNPTAAVTLETWFRPVGTPKAFVLMDNSQTGVTQAPLIIIGAAGTVSWFSTINSVTRNINNASSRLAKWNEWNFLSATYNGSAIILFLNGQQLTETTTGLSGSIGVNTGTFRMGAYFSGGSSLTMQGFIYRPRMYSVGISLAEHQDRYFRDITSASLLAGLRLDGAMAEGSGGTSADVSGNSNTITLGASASWSTQSPFKAKSATTRSAASGKIARVGSIQVT